MIAPDLRGHGDSAWAIGGMYAIADFVLDVANLIDALGSRAGRADRPLARRRGLAALHRRLSRARAQARRDRRARPAADPARTDARPHAASSACASGSSSVRKLGARQPRRYASIDAAAARMREENAFLSDEQAKHLTVHSREPQRGRHLVLEVRQLRAQLRAVPLRRRRHARALGPHRMPDAAGARRQTRGRAIRRRTVASRRSGTPRLATIPDAGHWVHHDQLDAFVTELRRFLAE